MVEFFDAKFYLERRFTDPEDKERGVQPFYMRSIHNFYQAYSGFWDPQNCKLLEFGGGPCLYPLISATPYVSDVTFAEYDSTARKAVNAWKSSAEEAHNWSPYFEYVISKFEDEKTDLEKKSSTRQKQLKSKISKILAIDIMKEEVFEEAPGKFNIVSSNFCLETVATTLQEYREYVKKLKSFVKEGGFLIGLVSLEETYWLTFSGEHSPHLYLMEEEVKETYKEDGFEILQSVTFDIDEAVRFKLNDCKKLLFIATKLN